MQRVPEPELMLDEAQAEAYALADFESAHSSFVEQLALRLPDLPERARVLDVGCGSCDVTRRLAQRFTAWQFDAIDGALPMLRRAQECLALHGLGERVSLHRRLLPEEPPPHAPYDVIVSNSLLHHLQHPSTLWAGLHDWAWPSPPAPRGASVPGSPGRRTSVFVMDLMRPASREAARALVNTYAASEPEILRRDFQHSLLAAYTLDEVRQQLRDHALPRLSVRAISDRHWIAWGTLG